VLADGFSCRLQVEHLDRRARPLHLAELLEAHLPDRGPGTGPDDRADQAGQEGQAEPAGEAGTPSKSPAAERTSRNRS